MTTITNCTDPGLLKRGIRAFEHLNTSLSYTFGSKQDRRVSGERRKGPRTRPGKDCRTIKDRRIVNL